MVVDRRQISDTTSDDRPSLSSTPNGLSSSSDCNEPSRLSLLQISSEKRAKKVRFYRNGDRFFGGVLVVLSPDHYRSWDSLLSALSGSSLTLGPGALTCGVRNIYTVSGVRVSGLAELSAGCSYVCAGSEPFRQLHYDQLVAPTWSDARRLKTLYRPIGLSSPIHSPSTPPTHNNGSQMMSGGAVVQQLQLLSEARREYVKPKLISVLRSGCRPRRVVRFLLNRRTAHSLDQVLQELSQLVRLDSGAIKRLTDSVGTEVRELADLFLEEDVFFAYGMEKQRAEDFDLHPEEKKWVAGKSHARSAAGYLTSDCHRPVRRLRHEGTPPRADFCRTLATPGARRRRRKAAHVLSAGVARAEQSISCPHELRKQYWLGSKIGDGNFAVVYQCFHRNSGETFAVKMIDRLKCVGKEHMIDNEVAILQRVRHENIIRLVEHINCPEESLVCLVMELVERGDLFDDISAVTRYCERDVSAMLHDLASALAYLHRMSIVHRDVKPENLLLFRRGDGVTSVKLADFGLAQHVTAPLYTVCGTPTYVAPEILAGTGYGLQVDIWATGVITYILLCGFPPFASADNNQEELFDRILSGNFEFIASYWDGISELACQLIAAMLQVDPEARFTAEDILSHPWVSEWDSSDPPHPKTNGDRENLLDCSDDCRPRVASISSARSLPCISTSDHAVFV